MRVQRLIIISLLGAANLFAQFYTLAVTDDASQVYFATLLRLVSEASQNLSTNIFYRVDLHGAVQAVPRVPAATEPAFSQLAVHDGYPVVSGDGRLFSYTEYTGCQSGRGSSCTLEIPTSYNSYLLVDGKLDGTYFGGSAQMSRSGRFIYNYGTWAAFLYSGNYNELHDRQTGTVVKPPVTPASQQQAVTADGSVLGFAASSASPSLVLWNPLHSRQIPTTPGLTSAKVNDLGTKVVYETTSPAGTVLRESDLASGADIQLGIRPPKAGTLQASISNDGSLVAFVAEAADGTTQVWIAGPGSAAPRQLTSFPESVSEAVIDGLGTAVAAITGSRIVLVDVATAAVHELIGATPVCQTLSNTLTPGSLGFIGGTSLAPVAQAAPVPLPASLDGVQVLMNGVTPLPILSVAPGGIWFQLPWEVSSGQNVTIGTAYSSLFQGCTAYPVPVTSRTTYLFTTVDQGGLLTAAHQDFQSVVTAASPALPGEMIHLYALNMGSVTPAVKTGVPAPVAPLSKLDYQPVCTLNDAQLNVLFAGLAPGSIGVFQFDVQLPSTGAYSGRLTCGTPGNPYDQAFGTLPVAAQF